ILVFILIINSIKGQDRVFDSLKLSLQNAKHDTGRVLAMIELENQYAFYQKDSALEYFRRAFLLSESINYLYGQFSAYWHLSLFYTTMADYDNALATQLTALKFAEKLPDRRLESMAIANMLASFTYRIFRQYETSLGYTRLAIYYQLQS